MAKKSEILPPRSAQLIKQVNAKAERERLAWLDEKLAILPKKWRAAVRGKYDALRKRGNEKGGNVYVRRVYESVDVALDVGASDAEIMALSKVCALEVRNNLAHGGFGQWIDDYLKKWGARLPVEHDDAGIIARISCAGWWLRQLRGAHARACEAACIDAGLVHKHANLYVSDDTLGRRAEQKERNNKTLDNTKIENEAGEVLTLKQAADAGMANPSNRASELITRVKGFEDYAKEHNHICLFVTITTPSRFHAVRAGGRANPKYDGSKPNEAQSYLTGQWARARALMAKKGVNVYGLRVVEPHHDGTPHWHMAVFLKSIDELHIYRKAVKDCFLRAEICEGGERGAVLNRLKFSRLDGGGVVGYMLKYICKNLSGVELKGDDNEAINSEPTAARVEAWAATWRIRQFQQLGGHSVSVWRELRRVAGEELQGLEEGEPMAAAWRAAQKVGEKLADFCEYLKAQGGAAVKVRESAIKLDDAYLYKEGVYGLAIVHEVRGVRERYGELILKNNRVKWFRAGSVRA